MVRPAAFGFNAETATNNFFQSSKSVLTQYELQQNVLKEFDNMVQTLRDHDIEVIVIEDTIEPSKPDAVFPNNWLNTLPCGTVSVFPLFAINRRPEKRNDILKLLQQHYKVKDIQDWSKYEEQGQYLEGTGSMVIDHAGKLIYACLSGRTDAVILEKFASSNNYSAITFHATDMQGRPVYHTNVMMCIGENFAILCEEAIEDELEQVAVTQLLVATNHYVVPITKVQMHAFAGNMLEVKNRQGDHFLVMSQTAYNSLTNDQFEKMQAFAQPLPIAVPTIEAIEGGSVRCMMAEIFLEKK